MGLSMVALAKRAIACKDWRWMPGMRATIPDAPGNARIVSIDEVAIKGGFSDVRWDHDSWTYGHPRPCLPDLSDPATLGCLLALVREAWSEPTANTAPSWKGWDVERAELEPHGASIFSLAIGATEAEALVAALERAP